jgi:4,4-dimethyl-9beta,19-cyclopropylsterol-4alpha-methyl oxidase
MLPYATVAEAEAALGRAMTWSEAAWFWYSATTPDFCLYCHSVVFVLLVYTLALLPLALLELRAPAKLTTPYKLQPRVRLSPVAFLRCFKDTLSTIVLSTTPLPFISYPVFRVVVGIRAGLPLPSPGETAVQLLVYLLVEDYLGYWIHRLLHTEWCYARIHRVHHEFDVPMGYAAPYAHWAEVFVLGSASFAGLAMVPCHMLSPCGSGSSSAPWKPSKSTAGGGSPCCRQHPGAPPRPRCRLSWGSRSRQSS